MAVSNLKSLIGKLNDTCRRALEAAGGLCISRTNYNVEVEHWLAKIIEVPNTDLAVLLRFYDIDVSRLQRDLTAAIDALKTGNARAPALAPKVVDLAREAWLIGSIEFSAVRTRSGHILCALLTDPDLARLARDISREFEKISPEALRRDLPEVTATTVEAENERAAATATAAAAATPGAPGPRPGTKTPALDQFTTDLTDRARAGKVDPVLGRDAEIRQVMDILSRRRQNNPILTGEAGVGKTAVAEGFALRIATGDVPPFLKNVAVRTLDLGLLQAGAGIKGEFQNRLKSVIDEVKNSPTPIILFIDEAHTMIGAGGTQGGDDAANLLKPALARGELRTIAATTWAEYKKYFEKDAALARRFQVVKIEEPTEIAAIEMMRGVVHTLQKHHKVRVLDEAVIDAVKLSSRYISGRQLPDKCYSLLDTACGKVAVGDSSTPAAIEDCRRRIEQLTVASDILNRETASGSNHQERLAELTETKTAAVSELAALEKRWEDETRLVGEIRAIRERLESGSGAAPAAAALPAAAPPAALVPAGGPAKAVAPPDPKTAAPLSSAEREKLRADLDRITRELRALQGDTPLVQVCVDAQAVSAVVAAWTGIPVGRMVADEIKTVQQLQAKLEERIFGQSHALTAITESIQMSRVNLKDPRKPIGVFLMVGTAGVGKTETAIVLAELLYGGEQNMTVLNMSEFKEEHKVSTLMGSPPGYVGYGEGGVLTEAVRRKPYSVVLLDEIEKAHPGVHDVFFQVFDKGAMKDSEGRDINFKNTVIIMTSNAATDLITRLCADPDTRPDPENLRKEIEPELLKTFKQAFLDRCTIVPYYPLTEEMIKKITELQLNRIRKRIRENYKATFTYDRAVIAAIADRCKQSNTGGRIIERTLNGTMLPELAAEFLGRMADGKPISRVHVKADDKGEFQYLIE